MARVGAHERTFLLGWVFALSVIPGSVASASADQELPVAYRVPAEPRVQIGTIDGDGTSLFGVTDAIRLRDGRIVVADGGSGTLKFFDSRGAFVRALGRPGDGPGEFRRLYRVAELTDGALAALDLLLERVTVFSPDGRLQRTHDVSRDLNATGRRVHLYGFLANGTLVGLEELEGEGVEAHYGDYPGSVLTYRAPIVQPVLIDAVGRVVSFGQPTPGSETVYQMQSSTGGDGIRVGGHTVSAPFLRTVTVAVRGEWIALGPVEGHFVGTFHANGAPRTFFAGPPPKAVPERVREAWLDARVSRFPRRTERAVWRSRYEEFLAFASASMTFPPFTALALQEGGRVWRELYDPATAENGPSRWVVTDPSVPGDFGGTVVLPPGFRPYDIGRDYVLGVWSDEMGIEFVRLYDLIEASSNG